MDVIFALAYNEGVSPVTVSLRKDIPHAGSLEARRIINGDAQTTGRAEKGDDRKSDTEE